jgi:hypothetical protein
MATPFTVGLSLCDAWMKAFVTLNSRWALPTATFVAAFHDESMFIAE